MARMSIIKMSKTQKCVVVVAAIFALAGNGCSSGPDEKNRIPTWQQDDGVYVKKVPPSGGDGGPKSPLETTTGQSAKAAASKGVVSQMFDPEAAFNEIATQINKAMNHQKVLDIYEKEVVNNRRWGSGPSTSFIQAGVMVDRGHHQFVGRKPGEFYEPQQFHAADHSWRKDAELQNKFREALVGITSIFYWRLQQLAADQNVPTSVCKQADDLVARVEIQWNSSSVDSTAEPLSLPRSKDLSQKRRDAETEAPISSVTPAESQSKSTSDLRAQQLKEAVHKRRAEQARLEFQQQTTLNPRTPLVPFELPEEYRQGLKGQSSLNPAHSVRVSPSLKMPEHNSVAAPTLPKPQDSRKEEVERANAETEARRVQEENQRRIKREREEAEVRRVQKENERARSEARRVQEENKRAKAEARRVKEETKRAEAQAKAEARRQKEVERAEAEALRLQEIEDAQDKAHRSEEIALAKKETLRIQNLKAEEAERKLLEFQQQKERQDQEQRDLERKQQQEQDRLQQQTNAATVEVPVSSPPTPTQDSLDENQDLFENLPDREEERMRSPSQSDLATHVGTEHTSESQQHEGLEGDRAEVDESNTDNILIDASAKVKPRLPSVVVPDVSSSKVHPVESQALKPAKSTTPTTHPVSTEASHEEVSSTETVAEELPPAVKKPMVLVKKPTTSPTFSPPKFKKTNPPKVKKTQVVPVDPLADNVKWDWTKSWRVQVPRPVVLPPPAQLTPTVLDRVQNEVHGFKVNSEGFLVDSRGELIHENKLTFFQIRHGHSMMNDVQAPVTDAFGNKLRAAATVGTVGLFNAAHYAYNKTSKYGIRELKDACLTNHGMDDGTNIGETLEQLNSDYVQHKDELDEHFGKAQPGGKVPNPKTFTGLGRLDYQQYLTMVQAHYLYQEAEAGRLHYVMSPLRRAQDTLFGAAYKLIEKNRFALAEIKKATDLAADVTRKLAQIFILAKLQETSSNDDCSPALMGKAGRDGAEYPSPEMGDSSNTKVILRNFHAGGKQRLRENHKPIDDEPTLNNIAGILKFTDLKGRVGNKFRWMKSKLPKTAYAGQYFHITITEGEHAGKTAWVNSHEFDFIGRPSNARPLPDVVQGSFFNGRDPAEVFDIEHNWPMTDAHIRSDTGGLAWTNAAWDAGLPHATEQYKAAKRRAQMHAIFAVHHIWIEKDLRLALGLPPMTCVLSGTHSLTIKTFFQKFLTRPEDEEHPGLTKKQDNGSLTSSALVWKTDENGDRMWTKVKTIKATIKDKGSSSPVLDHLIGKEGVIKDMATDGDVPSQDEYIIIFPDGSEIRASPLHFEIVEAPFGIQHSSQVIPVVKGGWKIVEKSAKKTRTVKSKKLPQYYNVAMKLKKMKQAKP